MTEASDTAPAGPGRTVEADKRKGARRLVTPEGIDLRLQLASGSERMSALFIDLFFMLLILIALTILALLFGGALNAGAGTLGTGREILTVIWLLGAFFLRIFYFPWFELGPRAATPGKRIIGIRVAPRQGGRLDASSILARNAMREVELFLPVSFLVASSAALQESVDAWIVLLGTVWAMIFAIFPLFNRDRLRPGDMIAGTWVIKAPRRRLEDDLAAEGEQTLGAYTFTAEQLDAYGVRELHVLEDILRAGDAATMQGAAERIRRKIRHPAGQGDSDQDFLNAYYTALRERLEKRLLYGVRRRDKHDRR